MMTNSARSKQFKCADLLMSPTSTKQKRKGNAPATWHSECYWIKHGRELV